MFKLNLPCYALLTVFTVDLLATSGDITLSWTSPILPKLHSNDSNINPLNRPITANEESWIGSLINIGALIGPFPFGYLAEKFGRKIALLAIAVPHICSYLTLAFARNVNLYYFARLLGGISLGGGYTLLPMYIAEISEDSNRGKLSVTLNIFWTFGNLLPYILGPYLSITIFNLILACVPLSFFILFILLAPETPYYLIKRKQFEEAENCLMKLRSKSKTYIEKEISEIKNEFQHNENGHFTDLFKSPSLLKALGISIVLITTQQFCGCNAILFYTQLIFDAADTNIPSELSSIVIGLMLFSTSFFTPFFADRFGRKILLLISAAGMAVTLVTLGGYFYLKNNTQVDVHPFFWVPIVSLVIYIASFNCGFGPVPWTVTSELFPVSVKSVAAAIVTFTCWLLSFLITKYFNDLNAMMGIGETYWLFAGFCVIGFLFILVFLPETKGKTFMEIQNMLKK